MKHRFCFADNPVQFRTAKLVHAVHFISIAVRCIYIYLDVRIYGCIGVIIYNKRVLKKKKTFHWAGATTFHNLQRTLKCHDDIVFLDASSPVFFDSNRLEFPRSGGSSQNPQVQRSSGAVLGLLDLSVSWGGDWIVLGSKGMALVDSYHRGWCCVHQCIPSGKLT